MEPVLRSEAALALQDVLDAVWRETSQRRDFGKNADYIGPLAEVDPRKFAIAVAGRDGGVVSVGDADEPFSVQSISKVFALSLALGKVGDSLWMRVGREPSGNRFNSIVQLEHEGGVPRNPFINAGAIVVCDLLLAGHAPKEAIGEMLRFVRFLADEDSIVVDAAVAAAETANGFRNAALANFMRACGNLEHSPELVLGVYFHHCAVAMSCRQLASAGRYLAFGGLHPSTGRSVIPRPRARRINALMLTCGHYDGSGDFAFRVGLPAKSGVGGGILAIVPGVASVAVWSPGLDEHGNSKFGTAALETLANRMSWSVFG